MAKGCPPPPPLSPNDAVFYTVSLVLLGLWCSFWQQKRTQQRLFGLGGTRGHAGSRISRVLARVSAHSQRILTLQRALTEPALWSTTPRAGPQRPSWRVVACSQLSGLVGAQLRGPPRPPHRFLSPHSPPPCFPRAPFPTSVPPPVFFRASCTSLPLNQCTL